MSADLRLTDARTLAAGVRRGDIGSALELARRVEPITIEDLLMRAVPSGHVTVEAFDCVADAWSAYKRMKESREQRDRTRARVAQAA